MLKYVYYNKAFQLGRTAAAPRNTVRSTHILTKPNSIRGVSKKKNNQHNIPAVLHAFIGFREISFSTIKQGRWQPL